MLGYNESRLHDQVNTALLSVRKVLENNRNPRLAADVPHAYGDKYGLADLLTNTALAGDINCLELLGVEGATLKTMKGWATSGRSVTLRLVSSQTCDFDRETTREVESATKNVTDWESTGGITGAVSSLLRRVDKTVTRITEFFWTFKASYELSVYAGADPAGADRVVLRQRAARTELMTTVKEPQPYPKSTVGAPLEVNITWLLNNVGAKGLSFAINRGSPTTYTPRRNADIAAAHKYFQDVYEWANAVDRYFVGELFPVQQKNDLNMRAINDNDVFVPVVPLFEVIAAAAAVSKSLHPDAIPLALVAPPSLSASASASSLKPASPRPDSSSSSSSSSTPLIPLPDINRFLSEQRRSLSASATNVAKTFPAPEAAQLVSSREVNLAIVAQHMAHMSQRWADGLDYIEDMLRQQLVAAIGRSLLPSDFADYMRFHYRKIFQTAYLPKPFAYAIRRPPVADAGAPEAAAGVMTGAGLLSTGSGCNVYSPEGVLTFQASPSSGATSSPIFSCVSHRPAHPAVVSSPLASGLSSPPAAANSAGAKPMSFPINAATRISFRGDTYVHAIVNHQFSGETGATFSLSARSRQFSSFVIVIGTIVAADALQPKYAFIAQNRDEYVLPLSLAALPSPQEFQDAIESLSPDQQRFAKAFRGMQLEATLFAVVAIQIKPQLEELLRIPAGGLVKELKLTEEVLELLLKYNIPSDMLSFDPELVTAAAAPDVLTPPLLPPPSSSSSSSSSSSLISKPRSPRSPSSATAPKLSPARFSHLTAVREVAKCVDDMNAVIQIEKDKEMQQKLAEAKRREAELSRERRQRERKYERKYEEEKRCERKESSMVMKKKSVQKSKAKSGAADMMSFDDAGGGALGVDMPELDIGGGEAQLEDGGGAEDAGGDKDAPEGAADTSLDGEAGDISKIPTMIEDRMAALEKAQKNASNLNSNLGACSLRPTIITVVETWTKTSHRSLMSPATTTSLAKKQIEDERNRTFDLLDALTRGGSLPLVAAELHVVIATTHCFDKTLVESVIQDNLNPIEQVERSVLMLAGTIHNVPVSHLLRADHVARVMQQAPVLFQPSELVASAAAGLVPSAAEDEHPAMITSLTHSTMFQ